MALSKKLQKWVEQGIITKDQADKITELEGKNQSSMAWRMMFLIAGLFIGLGIVLLIGANWDYIPASLKISGNFTIWLGILYGAYWSITHKKENIREMFLTLSFLMVGATIGLIGQIFNLSGGWESFAFAWALLGIPYIILSRLVALNTMWIILLLTGFKGLSIFSWLHWLYDTLSGVPELVTATAVLALIGYAGAQLHETVGKIIILPQTLSKLSMFIMYVVIIFCGWSMGVKDWGASIFVLIFFGIRMAIAFIRKNPRSFRNNTLLIQLFIFFIFITRFENLFKSGIGFILGGALLLLLIYGLKKTSTYIKNFDWSKINEK